MSDPIWILGVVIVALVAAQVAAMTWDLARRVSHQEAQRARTARILEAQIEAARARRKNAERASLAWVGWRKFEVMRTVVEDGDGGIRSFHLAPHDGKPVPSFMPGQFLTFQLKIPGQPRPVVRCYSLSDAPGTGTYRVSIKRVPAPRGTGHPPGVSSNYFHDAVRKGDILDVKAPAGKFVLDPADDAPVVLLAGGVGVTPLLTMLNAIVGSGGTREVWFFYGVRHGGEQIMKDHLGGIARDHPNVRLHVCYSAPRESDVSGRDYQHAGRISVELLRRTLPSNNYEFYLCGPPPLMDSMIAGLGEWGVPKQKVHFEKFGPGPPKPRPKGQGAPAGPGLEVSFNRSGKKAVWTPSTGTLLDLARAQGIGIESGCERGDCGTCQTAIRKGSVKYEEKPAFEFEAGTCLVCCAVPEGPLELDT